MNAKKPRLLNYLARGARGDFESQLVKCPACSHVVGSAAVACPACGHPIKPQQSFGYVAGVFVIAIVLILVAVGLWF
jgi:hypothetical protein